MVRSLASSPLLETTPAGGLYQSDRPAQHVAVFLEGEDVHGLLVINKLGDKVHLGLGGRYALVDLGNEPPHQLDAALLAQVPNLEEERLREPVVRPRQVLDVGRLQVRGRARRHGRRSESARIPALLSHFSHGRVLSRFVAVAPAFRQHPVVLLDQVEQADFPRPPREIEQDGPARLDEHLAGVDLCFPHVGSHFVGWLGGRLTRSWLATCGELFINYSQGVVEQRLSYRRVMLNKRRR